VTHVEIEIERLEARDAVIRRDRLPKSGQTSYVLVRESDSQREPDSQPQADAEAPPAEALFDLPAAAPLSPYDPNAEAA